MQERTDGPQVVKIEQRAADYNLTEHCNLRCAGCDHSSPLLPKKFAEGRGIPARSGRAFAGAASWRVENPGGRTLVAPRFDRVSARCARERNCRRDSPGHPRKQQARDPVREKSVSKRTDARDCPGLEPRSTAEAGAGRGHQSDRDLTLGWVREYESAVCIVKKEIPGKIYASLRYFHSRQHS
jgi:hypothetical protein